MRALIVDDSRFIRQYLRQLLERIGLSCEEASDGQQALEMLRASTAFDFMLLDVNMPKVNGFEVLEAVKNDPLLKEIPILMLTCSGSDFDKKLAYEKKANFYIVKPGDLSEFFDIVKYVEQIWVSGRKQA